MNNRLQELTEKVYQEGIEKAQNESKEILQQARQEAERIVQEAHKSKEHLLENANAEAESIKKNINSELQLAAKQITSKLKQDIQHLLQQEIINEPVKRALESESSLQAMLIQVVDSLQMHKDGNLSIRLNPKDEQNMGASLSDAISKKFNQGVTINPDKGLKSGFKIGPENGNYRISFSDEDFNQFFAQYLRKETLKYFNEKSE